MKDEEKVEITEGENENQEEVETPDVEADEVETHAIVEPPSYTAENLLPGDEIRQPQTRMTVHEIELLPANPDSEVAKERGDRVQIKYTQHGRLGRRTSIVPAGTVFSEVIRPDPESETE
jgi:hypothetical protein